MILKTNSEVRTPKRIQIPERWIVKPLQEVIHCSFGGGTPSTKNPCFWNGPIPWITTAIINSDEIFLKCFQRGITQEALDSTSTQLAPKGSVLIGTRVGVGKIAVTTFDVAINQDITAFVLKENVDAEFLAYCMKQQAMQSWFEDNKRGTTIKGVARNTILNITIPLPPLPEQRAISRVLRAVQGAREARQREVALERERKAALMEHLFTHGTRGEAMKQTEIGEMPESWKIIRLGEVFDVQLGKMLSSKSRTGISPRPYLRNANVRWGKIDLSDLSSSAARRLLKRYISLECVVTTITTTITKVQSACSLPRCGENRSL
jgi:type I restriction enzyme S subunit